MLPAVLTTALLAGAALPLWRAGQRTLAGVVALTALAVLAGVAAGPADTAPPPDRPVELRNTQQAPTGHRGYATSDSCRKCHPGEFASWHASFHRTMTQTAEPTHIVADFDGPTGDGVDLTLRTGTRLHLRRIDARYFVRFQASTDEPRPLPDTAELVQVTGSHHIQVFWYPTRREGAGRELGLLPVCWRIDEQRWIPVEAAFLMPPGTTLHVDPGAWNTSCLNCHTTAPQPRLGTPANPRAPTPSDTVVSEFGISCEACHGPAEEHVAHYQGPMSRYKAHLGLEDPQRIAEPTALDPARGAEVCGQCHSVSTARQTHYMAWRETGYPYRPGDNLRDTRLVVQPRRPTPEMAYRMQREPALVQTTFWSDGVVRVSGREYNGLIESPCHVHGEGERKMTCTSCHSMHAQGSTRPDVLADWRDDQPGTDASGRSLLGDAGCIQCHEDKSDPAAVAAHTHHPVSASGSRCANCHMGHSTYGLLKAIRSHTIESPDVATEVATGRPNACNQCHLDQTLDWTAGHLERWYGTTRPELDPDQRTVAASILWALRGDAGQRALAAWSFGWDEARAVSGTDWMLPYLAELAGDDYDAVRFIARRSLQKHAVVADAARAWDFLGDPTERRRFSERVVDAWRRRTTAGAPADGGAGAVPRLLLLQTGSGSSLDTGRVQQLLAKRDRRPVFLGE